MKKWREVQFLYFFMNERIRENWPHFLVPGYGKRNCFCDRSISVKQFSERPLKYVLTKL